MKEQIKISTFGKMLILFLDKVGDETAKALEANGHVDEQNKHVLYSQIENNEYRVLIKHEDGKEKPLFTIDLSTVKLCGAKLSFEIERF